MEREAEVAEVIIPLDVASSEEAVALVDLLGEQATFYKVGLELFTAAGADVVAELRRRSKRIFLDLKFHDIPHTVGRAVEAAAAAGIDLLTVHATGGRKMLDAAREAADRVAKAEGHRVRLLGVTVLTSAGAEEVEVAWGRSIRSVRDEVLRLAALSTEAGLDGVVVSALEAQAVRRAIGEDRLIVTPGIRFAGGEAHDQTRVTTPRDAARAGANYLVVGRAITGAPDPLAALERCADEIRSVVA